MSIVTFGVPILSAIVTALTTQICSWAATYMFGESQRTFLEQEIFSFNTFFQLPVRKNALWNVLFVKCLTMR